MPALIRALLFCATVALLIAPPSTARAQDGDVDIGYFYEQLEPYGRWIDHPRWGDVWSPDVDRDWRPYSMGHWSYTDDDGWYWVSEEPFGWAVFHYGRWVIDEDDGWLWIPGTEWAPAWVAWRADDDDDGYVGWAPLPPDAHWGPDGNLVYDDRYYYDSPHFASMWVFVRPTYMTTPGMYRYAAPRPQISLIFRRARHLHTHRRFDRRVFNAGFDFRRYERSTGRPLPRMRLRKVDNPRDFSDRGRGGSDIPVFRPNIVPPRDGNRPRPTFKNDRRPGDRGPSFGRGSDDRRDAGPDRRGPPDGSRDRGPSTGRGPGDSRDPGPDRRGPPDGNRDAFKGTGPGSRPGSDPDAGKRPPSQDMQKKGPGSPDNRGPDGRGPDNRTKGTPPGDGSPGVRPSTPPDTSRGEPRFKGPTQQPGVQDKGPPAMPKGPPQGGQQNEPRGEPKRGSRDNEPRPPQPGGRQAPQQQQQQQQQPSSRGQQQNNPGAQQRPPERQQQQQQQGRGGNRQGGDKDEDKKGDR